MYSGWAMEDSKTAVAWFESKVTMGRTKCGTLAFELGPFQLFWWKLFEILTLGHANPPSVRLCISNFILCLWCYIKISIERGSKQVSPNLPLWQEDSFELKAVKTQQIQEKLFTSSLHCLILHQKGGYTSKRVITRDSYLPKRLPV